MSLDKWELAYLPSDKDEKRWKLKLKIRESELMPLLNSFRGTVGRPFLIENEEYDFGLYFYEADEKEIEQVEQTLLGQSSNGRVKRKTSEESIEAMLNNLVSGLPGEDSISDDVLDKNKKEEAVSHKISVNQEENLTNEVPEKAEENEVPFHEISMDKSGNEVSDIPVITEEKEVPFHEISIDRLENIAVENIEKTKEKEVVFQEISIQIEENAEKVKLEEKSNDENSLDRSEPESESESEFEPGKEMVEEYNKVYVSSEDIVKEPKPEDANITNGVEHGSHLFNDLDLNTNYTFNEFIIGPNNRFTAAAARAVADNPGKIYNPFFIYGGVGLGKTHLMHAVGHYVRTRNPKPYVMYVSSEKFMGDVIDAIRGGTIQQMRDHYRKVDLLLVDDIQFLVESESTQEEFFHTFNILHQNSKQIIITSDRPPKLLTTLEDRLRSRFEWGLIADIKSPNLETRVAILKKKGEVEKLVIDDNILLFIASKLKSNIRELEGFLKRINAYASLTNQEVNMELVQSIMSDLMPEDPAEMVVSNYAPAPITEMPAVPIKQAYVPPLQINIKEINMAELEKNSQEVEIEPGMKLIEAIFFYPDGKDGVEEVVKVKFEEVVKKHKLKFNLVAKFNHFYSYSERIEYVDFVNLCRKNKVNIAVVLGPPPEAGQSVDDFENLLFTVMDDEKISLQYVPWSDYKKDYRYLNLALDITLLKHKF